VNCFILTINKFDWSNNVLKKLISNTRTRVQWKLRFKFAF